MSYQSFTGSQQQQQVGRHLKATRAAITGAANNGSGLIRITATGHRFYTGNTVAITAVGGTVEANATWKITVITTNTFDLNASTFTNAYTSGGSAVRTQT